MGSAVIFDFDRTLYDPDTQKLVDGCLEVLAALKSMGVRLYLLTSKKGKDRVNQISSLGIEDFFEYIDIFEGENTIGNFLEAMKRLRLAPEEVFFVGDRVEKGINLANQVGMLTVWFQNGKFSNRLPETYYQSPFFVIRRLDHLPQILQQLN